MHQTFEHIASLKLDGFGTEVTAGDLFSRGNCHQLALALCETVASSQIVALVDCFTDSASASHSPYIVHAAILTQDGIIDIEGLHDVDQWIERWRDQARQPEFVEYEEGELPWEYTAPHIRNAAQTIAVELSKELAASSVMPVTPLCRPR